MEPVIKEENLKREIGVRSLTLAIFNITVGTGIFIIPAIVSEIMGASAIVAYLVCGALMFLIALCFAELGSKTICSGGTYTYIENAFGPYAGFLANNVYWFGSSVMADAALANGLADTLKYFFPFLGIEMYRILFFLFIFGGLALINIRSVKHGVRFIELATFVKLIPLVLLVVVGAGSVSLENLHWSTSPSISNVGAASLILFFAFMGMETPLSNGGEIKNAKRTVPLAIMLGIFGVLILYIAIQLVTQGILGNNITAHKDAPLAAVAGIIFGKAGITLIITGTAVSMFGAMGGDILSIPRILFAGARDGLLPKPLARVHPKFFTPHVAILFYISLGFLFAVFGGFRQLATISSAASLLVYLGIVLATLKLRKNGSATGEKTFRVPGGVIIPLLSVCVIIWLLSNLTKPELSGITIFMMVISFLYLLGKLLKKKPISKKV